MPKFKVPVYRMCVERVFVTVIADSQWDAEKKALARCERKSDWELLPLQANWYCNSGASFDREPFTTEERPRMFWRDARMPTPLVGEDYGE